MTSDVLVLDGGLSTALEQLGWSSAGPLWTGEVLLRDPDIVTRAHRAFVESGADIIITGSYQLSFEGGRRLGYRDDDIERALRASTTAARLASDETTLVAASIGPFGAHLNDGSEFTGYSGIHRAALRTFHDRRLDVILETEPDLLAIETIPELVEAEIVLELLQEKSPRTPAFVSFTLATPGRLSGGAPFSEACALVSCYDAAVAVGVNCSHPDVITPTLRDANTDLPFVAYPNAGKVWNSETMTWGGARISAGEREIHEWIDLGAIIVGGCCGYGPADIAGVRGHLTP